MERQQKARKNNISRVARLKKQRRKRVKVGTKSVFYLILLW